ncbi:flavin monoamine oxidase family protein [Rhodotorula paludigena]|uniref:flavin monoamine oxidase family protein n=1 Tax=Rhodotorula paludigena TaxID=86838 RepID=UPI00316EE24E
MAAYDAVIIGAGMSGLTAAFRLSGYRIALVEARNRVGGRIHTAGEAEGLKAPVDLGGSMIHGFREGNPAARLVTKELGMDVHVPEGAKGLIYGRDGVLAEAEATSLLSRSAQTAFKAQPDTPADASIASLLLPRIGHDPRLVGLARTAEIGAGIPLEEMAAKWAGFEQGFAGTDGFPEGGYGEVVRNLLAEVKAAGGEIHLGHEVSNIEDLGAGKGVKVTTKQGQELTAQAVISTIPHAVLQHAPPTFSPPLSPYFTQAVQRMRTGSLEKVVLSYPSAWWPSPSENGSFLLLPLATPGDASFVELDGSSTLEQIFRQTVIPVSSFERIAATPHPTLLAYVGARAARLLARFSTDEIAAAMHAYIVSRLAPSSPPPAPSVHLVTSWQSDPFSRGATSTPIALQQGDEASPLDFVLVARPAWDGRLGFAGEHTDMENHGSVGGAVISGEREARRVRELLERVLPEA